MSGQLEWLLKHLDALTEQELEWLQGQISVRLGLKWIQRAQPRGYVTTDARGPVGVYGEGETIS